MKNRSFLTLSSLTLLTIALAIGGCSTNQPAAPAPNAKSTEAKSAETKPAETGNEIFLAAASGDAKEVERLLAAGAGVNTHDQGGTKWDKKFADRLRTIGLYGKNGLTPLHYAAIAGHKDVAELLIAKGADVNAKGRNGVTPLFYPKSAEIAALLIAKGADVNAAAGSGATPLFFTDSREIAELLIAKGADVNAKAMDGATALFTHSHNGRKDIVELLIAKGADLNARDSDGNTALFDTVWMGRKDIAELQIAHGADVNARGRDGETPLFSARSGELVDLLIAKGADVNARNKYGVTPLFSRDKEGTELLIAKGADVNAKGAFGITPIFIAKDEDVAALLIAKGANIHATIKAGKANPKETDEVLSAIAKFDGATPLHTASSGGKLDVAELLIAKGLKVNARDKQGKTPLMYAASRNNDDVVAMLIAKGADVKAKDKHGKAYQDYALEMKLYMVDAALDPVRNTLVYYYQKHGDFPVGTASADGSQADKPATAWANLGFALIPALPDEIASLEYSKPSESDKATLTIKLRNMKPGTVDGKTITSWTAKPEGKTQPITWHYKCDADIDVIAKKYLKCE